jgi:hypothetical protein
MFGVRGLDDFGLLHALIGILALLLGLVRFGWRSFSTRLITTTIIGVAGGGF